MKKWQSSTRVLSLCLLSQTSSFPLQPGSLHNLSYRDLRSSSTELHGLRTFLRRKFSKSKYSKKGDSNSETQQESNIFQEVSTSNPPCIPSPSSSSSSSLSSVEDNGLMQSLDAKLPVQVLDDTLQPHHQLEEEGCGHGHGHGHGRGNILMTHEVPIQKTNTLPPIGNRKLTKLETEFRDMLDDFSQYTERDIMAVRNPRMRAIFNGVAASYGLPEVYRAFEILFQDYAPLRVAGRLIYGKLKNVMEDAKLEREKEVDSVAELTGLPKDEIEASRSAYFQLIVHQDDAAAEMTLEQIVDLGIAEMAIEILGYDSFEDFVDSLNPCEQQKVDFERLMCALQSCPIDDPSPGCNPSTVLKEIAQRIEGKERLGNTKTKKTKIDERYAHMVSKFREWKDLVPSGDGRRLEILRGCFVGAESDAIVKALKVVYVDYSALRMSGDLIFKIMATLVGRKIS